MTIEKDGTATLKFYGLVNQGIIGKGKISNPLMLFPDGDGLLFKEDKVYEVTGNGEIKKGCKGEGIPCETSLSDTPITQQKRFPFIGTKYFNFAGGSGTWQSITIQKDGIAILRFYGVVSQATTWKGKFTNPLKQSPNEGGLLFKEDKVYGTTDTGEIKKGCKSERMPCETNLHSRWLKGLFGAYAPSELVAQTSDPRKVEADSLLQVGITQFTRTSQIDLALSYFQQALGLYREIKDRRGEAIALCNLGRTYQRWGIHTKSITYFQQVLAITSDLRDKQSKITALGELGNAHVKLAPAH